MKKQARFTILRHSQCVEKRNHYDIVIERCLGTNSEEVALAKYESLRIRQVTKAIYDSDVRRRYLTYEGPMGENKGVISQIDSGSYETLPNGNLLLVGKKLRLELKIR